VKLAKMAKMAKRLAVTGGEAGTVMPLSALGGRWVVDGP
jgi:hypothetical protein